ncbi:MTA/SAH nucleosidase [Kingella oralis ATCC 51147]|jgi:MTA/SAH nucleosidase|uniref:5'-methylthioadenosine/S-adenosylhomocysteine nucleosidase n=1 Tax=Kingella oralis ATCC 51147 TaxID=629741 RepID=C4GF75_9NEIS|nr:MTA/SAH nucleosidase [Kingella oralis ATCC 51147]
MSREPLVANTIAIIGAMEAEVAHLKTRLGSLKTHSFGKVATIHTGTLHGKDIVLCQSGIGKVNAAIATTLVIEHFSPDCVINTGSAGGIGKGLQVGDVVIGTQVAHHDVDVTAFGYAIGQVPQQPASYESEHSLVHAAERAAKVFQAAHIRQGLIVSGDQFINDTFSIETICREFASPQAVEMEAAAIAQTCYQLGKPFVIIRAISDSADSEASISFDEFLATAALHSAQMVEELVKQL